MKELRTNILPDMKKAESSLKLANEELKEKKDLFEVKRCFVKYIFNNYNFFSKQKLKKQMKTEKNTSLQEKRKLQQLVEEQVEEINLRNNVS